MPRGTLLVRDLACPLGATLTQRSSISHAMAVLAEVSQSALPVLDEGGHLAGILSERDCMHALLAQVYGDGPEDEVGRHMSRTVCSIPADATLLTAIEAFDRVPYRRLPVVDDDGRVVGVLGRHEVIRAFRDRIDGWRTEAFVHRENSGHRARPRRSAG